MDVIPKNKLVDTLKTVRSLLEKYGQSERAYGKGLVPIFALGLSAFDQKKIEPVAAFMAEPGLHAFEHAPDITMLDYKIYTNQEKAIIAALEFYLGKKPDITNEKGVIDKLIADLAR